MVFGMLGEAIEEGNRKQLKRTWRGKSPRKLAAQWWANVKGMERVRKRERVKVDVDCGGLRLFVCLCAHEDACSMRGAYWMLQSRYATAAETRERGKGQGERERGKRRSGRGEEDKKRARWGA